MVGTDPWCRRNAKYCIGAILLDGDDPTRVIGRLHDPLIKPGTGNARIRAQCGLYLRRIGSSRTLDSSLCRIGFSDFLCHC